MPTDTIRASPYEQEKGIYFVGGTVGTSQWQVGTRYTLEKVLGHGGFSSVCLATDHQTGEKVALKRIPDVLSSPENAKRVLREVCILRRLSHPNIIAIKDCFVRPSATGQCRLINGKLVNLSIDVYIAMEFAEGGDLFHLKGQMSAEEVKSVMWQLASCIKYLHDLHVWHRDLKSQNVFVSWEGGQLVAKVGDFGSARSASSEGYTYIEQQPPSRSLLQHNNNANHNGSQRLHPSDSYDDMHRSTKCHDIYVRFEDTACGRRTGFKAPLTRVVATPCYRAPEVVMSRGGYSAAIDIWGLGCIFGELLHRVAHVGSAATPNLQIAPLFAIHDMPKTPDDGEKYEVGPGHQTTRIELQALFDVVGTPSWSDVEAVELPAWRHYLYRIPGKAPTLYRRFSAAGEVAVDLLRRMLSFDPSRRCSADEALAHEYFWDIMPEESGGPEDHPALAGMQRRPSRLAAHSGSEPSGGCSDAMQSAGASASLTTGRSSELPSSGLGAGQMVRGRSLAGLGMPPPRPRHLNGGSPPRRLPSQLALRTGGSQQLLAASGGGLPTSPTGPGIGVAAFEAAATGAMAAVGALPGDACAAAMDVDASPFNQPAAPPPPPQQQQQQQRQEEEGEAERILHYWEEKDPGRALGMLEEEMATITAAAPGSEGCQKLRKLLELECEAIAATHGGSFAPGGSAAKAGRRLKLPPHDAGVLSGLLLKAGPGLQLDTATDSYDPAEYGLQRLSHTTGARQEEEELDPEKYLGPQRHGEWTAFNGTGPAAGPAWGVTALPPGMDESSMDPQMAAVIKAQQLR